MMVSQNLNNSTIFSRTLIKGKSGMPLIFGIITLMFLQFLEIRLQHSQEIIYCIDTNKHSWSGRMPLNLVTFWWELKPWAWKPLDCNTSLSYSNPGDKWSLYSRHEITPWWIESGKFLINIERKIRIWQPMLKLC